MNKPGMALITVFLCLSASSVIILTAYQAIALLPIFSRDHIKYQADELMLDGACIYAREFCRENWKRLVFYAQQGEKQEIFFAPSSSPGVRARIGINLGTKEQQIEISLLKKGQQSCMRKISINHNCAIALQ